MEVRAVGRGCAVIKLYRTDDSGTHAVDAIGDWVWVKLTSPSLDEVESVASRLRESGMKCKGVQIMLRGNDLSGFVRQHKVRLPMNTSEPLVDEAMDLLRRNWRWQRRLRSISLSGIYLVSADTEMQLSLFDDKAEKLLVQENLEKAVDWIRWRFGHGYIKRCSSMLDAKLTNFNPRDYDLIHPYSYFR